MSACRTPLRSVALAVFAATAFRTQQPSRRDGEYAPRNGWACSVTHIVPEQLTSGVRGERCFFLCYCRFPSSLPPFSFVTPPPFFVTRGWPVPREGGIQRALKDVLNLKFAGTTKLIKHGNGVAAPSEPWMVKSPSVQEQTLKQGVCQHFLVEKINDHEYFS